MAMDDWTQSPAKRSYSRYEDEREERGSRDERETRDDRDDRDGGSRHKRRRASEPADPPSSASSDIEYRILCPVAKIGSVIGKGGSIIKTLRQDSHAKIKVEDVVHGADERIIYITSSAGKDHERRERDGEEMLCPAQDALFRIFSRITEKEESDNASHDEDEDEPTAHVTVRLLVSDGQVGCLIGKGGRIIEQMRKDIAAQIRVLPKASLPPCAFPNDELVQDRADRALFTRWVGASSSLPRILSTNKNGYTALCQKIFTYQKVDKRPLNKVKHDLDAENWEFLQLFLPMASFSTSNTIVVKALLPKLKLIHYHSSFQCGLLVFTLWKPFEMYCIISSEGLHLWHKIDKLVKFPNPGTGLARTQQQLSGSPALVREALYAVSTKLYENPVRERPHRPSGYSHGSSFPGGGMHSSFHTPGSLYGLGHYGGRTNSYPVRSSRSDGPLEEEFMICVLCPNDKIGSVIGKGGSVIRKLRDESGAKIRVCDQVGDAEERVIQISALEFIDSYASPTLEAVMQVYRRLAEISADRDGRHAILSIRLLVRANQIGCLLGKGGQIITEMRKTSRANIRIPPKEELPSCADENSELVQVSGESAMVETALIQVLTRLRSNLFSGRGGAGGNSGSHHGSGQTYSSRDHRDEPSSPGAYSYDYGHYNTSPGATRSSRDSRRRQR